MNQCDIISVGGKPCPGYHATFDDCLAEALYGWSIDDADESTGDTDFEGHLSLIVVPAATTAGIGSGADEHLIPVSAGNYLVWTATNGRVTLAEVDTEEGAREIFALNERRYDLWEAGCDPDDPQGHAECANYERCLITQE